MKKRRTSTKCYIKNELLRLEELLDVATCVGPIADWSAKGGCVNRALVICQCARYLGTLDDQGQDEPQSESSVLPTGKNHMLSGW